MAQKQLPGKEAADDSAPLPEARFPVVVSVYERLTTVTLADRPHRPNSGICGCDACGAWIPEGIRFQAD